jgi:hypothetical protein
MAKTIMPNRNIVLDLHSETSSSGTGLLGRSGARLVSSVRLTVAGRVGPPELARGRSHTNREELGRLRRENRTLRMERDILKKATAFFAKEHP